MKKSTLGLLTTFVLLSISCNGAFAKDFNDVKANYWADSQIQALANDGVIVGYPNGTFKPDTPVTRAEFATMVVKSLHQENCTLTETHNFKDVPTDYWAYGNIQRAENFNLLKGFPDGTFKPNANISKAEAISIIVSAIHSGNMTEFEAKKILSLYSDADQIPYWAVIPAAKSEKYNMTAHNPAKVNKFEPCKKITRAEVVVNIYNMQQEARLNPNNKLLGAMKKAPGRVIDNVSIQGMLATIPQGTLITASILTSLNSQQDKAGTNFSVKITQNLVTKDSYLLIPANSYISGDVTDVKSGRYFIRNAKMTLNTQYINTPVKQKAYFLGNINTNDTKKRGFFGRVIHYIVKGRKIDLPEGKEIFVKLDRPVTIDLSCTRIVK